MAGPPSTIPTAADRAANALRLYAEESLRAKALFAIDQDEAIDNLDRMFDGVLTALHSLYDAMKAEKSPLDWHAYGETAACILVRNARHHNAAGLFESWNSVMLKRSGLKAMAGAEFLMVGYRLVDEGGRVSEYYVPWDDFRARLKMPEARLPDPAALSTLLDRDCAFDKIRQKATAERYPANQVFVNLIPIVMNAATRVFAAIRSGGTDLSGFDSVTYASHFAAKPLAYLQSPTFKALKAPGA